MNTVGAMSSPVKQPLSPPVLTPNITNSSQPKVQTPPSVTPLNLNNVAQTAQPLSLVNENKNTNNGNPTLLACSNDAIIKKSVPCNGVSDVKPIEKKVEDVVPKPEQPIIASQHNFAGNKCANVPTSNLKIHNPTSTTTDIVNTVTEVENLSKKKEEKVSLPDKVENEFPPVEINVSEPVKVEEKTKPVAVKQDENEPQVKQEPPTEALTSIQCEKEKHVSASDTLTPEKSEHLLPINASKVAGQLDNKNNEVQDEVSNEDKPIEEVKSKRTRLPTQPFQLSLLPEMQLISKITTKTASPKTSNEKLTVFYKNEFLAVRNEEGGFYLCQAMQNIHRASRRIRIRWLAQHPDDEFTPDFYDHTEFDCILTNITLKKVQKEQWKLPEKEKLRIENILKRSIDVEKGSEKPSVTEEHPDGLDVSLYKDEAQLTKKKKSITVKRKLPLDDQQPVKKSSRLSKKKPAYDFGQSSSESDEASSDSAEEDNIVKKKSTPKKLGKKQLNSKESAKKSCANISKKSISSKKSQAPVKPTYVLASVSSALKKREITAAKQKNDINEKKSSKKVEQKSPVVPLPAERSSKTRNAGNAVSAKITTAGIGVLKTNPPKDRKAKNRK
ncbi:uncharacterized protein LOC126907456 isoform X2 [Daktulosphaira vitifoliae]|uniref:uncharacterized protein LOC126907456 isoform X2 n=1 Tax=Daktulosphaira vitifoliae TaxID=58002 RepID=UPI0021AA8F9A|nr:uncharacterized protein LOC126907456 isoform X2 [Daktulosphaira vitifoliae]